METDLSADNFPLEKRCAFSEKYFHDFCNSLFSRLHIHDVLLVNYQAEISDFVRINHNQVRQAGNVTQHAVKLTLINGARQANASFHLSSNQKSDLEQAENLLSQIRQQLPHLPDDPYLNFAEKPNNTIHKGNDNLPVPQEAVKYSMNIAKGLDLVGIWASGVMMSGFANSLGQHNWHSNFNFNFDWSIYHHGDKAIKQSYAGYNWDQEQFEKRIDEARDTTNILAKSPKTITPGKYRVYLTPSALEEIVHLLYWGGFSIKNHRTLQTPLIRLIRKEAHLNNMINLLEDQEHGLSPVFTPEGFIKPQKISLIKSGNYENCLTNARSAREYGTDVNCSVERPQSLVMQGGTLKANEIFSALDTGIYISNLWYGNYSDRKNCRMTGMTRFATLWVENGVPVAPLDVMRFDESLYKMFGDNLLNLTEQTDLILDPSSYEQRSQHSMRLPGALIDNFTFTL